MEEIIAKWKCSSCQTENWFSYNPKELDKIINFCCECGKAHRFSTEDKKSGWLNCEPYTGMGSISPSGVIVSSSGETLWADPNNGNRLTRDQFIKTCGWDPWTTWCRLPRNRTHPICKGYENRCKKTKPK